MVDVLVYENKGCLFYYSYRKYYFGFIRVGVGSYDSLERGDYMIWQKTGTREDFQNNASV